MTPTDPRADARIAFARAATGNPAIGLERASSDAGFRSYWRSTGLVDSRIVMDSPPDREDLRPWLTVHAWLEGGGVRVPRILARDVEAGFLLLEDLGSETCLDIVDDANADRLFDLALDQLLRLQRVAPPATAPRCDAALLERELTLFPEWFLARHLGLRLDPRDIRVLQVTGRVLIENALAQPQLLVHRDFMLRNLMPLPDTGLAVLDFQDAVIGPAAYDPICLFKDAFRSWPEPRVAEWLAHYHARAVAAGIPLPDLATFRRDADLIGVQRHLKVIGIFARLNYRDAKPRYLTDVPRFIAYLDAVLPRYPELALLADFLRDRVKPALRARGAA